MREGVRVRCRCELASGAPGLGLQRVQGVPKVIEMTWAPGKGEVGSEFLLSRRASEDQSGDARWASVIIAGK